MAETTSKTNIGGAKLVSKPKGEHFRRIESTVDNLKFMIGKNVWIKVDTDDMFVLATVESSDESKVHVKYDGQSMIVDINECLNVNIDINPIDVSDMVKLRHANSAVVLDVLRQRFHKDMIYTYAGRLLVACNPFKAIPGLYSVETIEEYRKSDTTFGYPSDLSPHVFAVAQCVMNGLLRNNKSQSCIVSGESGAGKTETARQLIAYFSHGPMNASQRVQSVILGSGAILEAFGNAKTLRNNNSSRFGKFLKILLAPNGGLNGGIISSFMLELSRIEFQSEGERNYHIFYQCIKGLDPEEIKKYGFLELNQYQFLNKHDTYDAPGIDDVAEFAETRQQLAQLFSKDTLDEFFKIISGILLCGNVEFNQSTQEGVDNAAAIVNEDIFENVCNLLGLDLAATTKAIINKSVVIQGNTIVSPVTVDVARVNIRAMAKDLYGALFDHCIDCINQVISFDEVQHKWIGILDIYGFEYFKNNTFEQLLINYANERLQAYFIKRVFQAEIGQYEAEGIVYSDIVYSDNSSVLAVFDKPNKSIFSFLEEQCLLQSGTCERFTQSCKANIKSENFIPAQGSNCSFKIVHTAATVVYNTEEFVKKNKHKLSVDICDVMHSSKNLLVAACSKRLDAGSGSGKGKFIGSKFHSSISLLMSTLEQTDSFFIRCIKSNQSKVPNVYETASVYNQLISLSIVDAIQTVHRGFAYNAEFKEFVRDFKFISTITGGGGDDSTDTGENGTSISSALKLLGIPETEFQIGKSRVFLKKKAWVLLERAFLTFAQNAKPLADALYSIFTVFANGLRHKRLVKMIIRVQSNIRRYRIQRASIVERQVACDFVGLILTLSFITSEDPRIEASIVIQAAARRMIARRSYLAQLEEIRQKAKRLKARQNLDKLLNYGRAVGIVSMLNKMHQEKVLNHAATTIANAWRRHCAIRRANNLRLLKICHFAATMIQKHVRRFLQQRLYRWYLAITPSVCRIQALCRGHATRMALRHYGTMGESLCKIRRRILDRIKITKFQTVIRTCIEVEEITQVVKAIAIVQKYAASAGAFTWFSRMSWAASVIARCWRRYKFKNLVAIEKQQLLLQAQTLHGQSLTRQETLLAISLWESIVGFETLSQRNPDSGIKRGWLPIHINVAVADAFTQVYPSGWCRKLVDIIGMYPESSRITSISMACLYTVMVIDDLYVYIFGIGENDNIPTSFPEPILELAPNLKVSSVVCGDEHAILKLSDGSLYGWGRDDYGQVGCGDPSGVIGQMNYGPHYIAKPNLIRFPLNSALEPPVIASVDAGSFHNCAVDVNGNLYVWGQYSDICLAQFSANVMVPKLVKSTANMPINSWKGATVSCGNRVTNLLVNGSLYTFGSAHNGQMGVLDTMGVVFGQINKLSIPSRVSSVSCGANYTLALCENSDLYVFGTLIVDQERLGVHVPTRIHVDPLLIQSSLVQAIAGWWDAVVLTRQMRAFGWNSLTACDDELKPLWYQFSKFSCTCSNIKIISSPPLSVVAIVP
ncbi:bifunctional Regulator of chromosome condensation [Babesia duncani]|uniref:Myosin-A n=1 Tax=Babesia duncani TaxID=323732 RepID=A0AAD9PNJ1_9APIC|nr:bifunctional Regulator of chromosome condensation [Babesia duncani]